MYTRSGWTRLEIRGTAQRPSVKEAWHPSVLTDDEDADEGNDEDDDAADDDALVVAAP